MHFQLGNGDHCPPFWELHFLDPSVLSGSVLESVSERHCAWFGRQNGGAGITLAAVGRGMDKTLDSSA